jgi:ribulose-5-phosphate 4-epimerase/fuculose-1-phosphate aldolase
MAVLSSVKSETRKIESRGAAFERAARVDLAAAFRLAALNDWHEAIANHFSLAISDDGKTFLMNPKWVHFSSIRAGDLLSLHADDKAAMQRPNAPDPSAWCIHGAIHAALPHARCILHVHPPYATAMCALADPDLKPIDQNTARFFNRLVIDLNYGGIADNDAEGARLARALGAKSIMMMGNHGVLVTGQSVAEAYDALYYLERACQTMVLAYSTGRPLNVMPKALAEVTAKGWEEYTESSFAHFAEMKRVLDRQDASYAD